MSQNSPLLRSKDHTCWCVSVVFARSNHTGDTVKENQNQPYWSVYSMQCCYVLASSMCEFCTYLVMCGCVCFLEEKKKKSLGSPWISSYWRVLSCTSQFLQYLAKPLSTYIHFRLKSFVGCSFSSCFFLSSPRWFSFHSQLRASLFLCNTAAPDGAGQPQEMGIHLPAASLGAQVQREETSAAYLQARQSTISQERKEIPPSLQTGVPFCFWSTPAFSQS